MKSRRLQVVILVVWFCFFGSRSALCYVAPKIVALDMSSIAWSGGSQLLNSTWKAGNVLKTFRTAFNPASLAYVLGSVVVSWAVEEYAPLGVNAIKTWMAAAGIAVVGGQLQVQNGSGGLGFVVGSQWATDHSAAVAALQSTYGSGSVGATVINTAEGCQAWYTGHSPACNYWNLGSMGQTQWIQTEACLSGPGWTLSTCSYPTTAHPDGVATIPPPYVAGTAEDVRARAEVDLTNATPAAQAAVVEAERAIDRALAVAPYIDIGAAMPVAVPTGGMLDKPAPGLPATVDTPRKAVEIPAAAAIGQPLIDMGGAADPVPGEITPPNVVPDAKPYVDPGYAGTYTKAAWDTVDGFGTRLASFTNSIKTTGLFQIPGGLFQGIPSGGSSSFTINGGTNFGTHEVDLASWSSLLLILRTCFMVGFAYGSAKIVIVH